MSGNLDKALKSWDFYGIAKYNGKEDNESKE